MKLRRTELKKARIEIIPMIDTIFFLLVFFMITSLSMVQMSARKVNLPTSSTAQQKPLDKVVISLASDNTYSLDRNPVAYKDILPALQQRVRQDPNVIVVLNVDKNQQVGEFQRIMALAQLANPGQLMIATAPREAQELRP